LRLALVASTLFDDYFLTHRAIEIRERHIALLGELKRSAEAQYVVGRASQQDALQAEVELAHLEHERMVLGHERARIRARLNGLLHRRPELPLPPAPESLPTPDLTLPPTAELQAQALANRPELAGTRARMAAGEAGV